MTSHPFILIHIQHGDTSTKYHNMTNDNCTTTGTFHPCLYPACSRLCIEDRVNAVHACNSGNGFFRGCACGQLGIADSLWTDLMVNTFFADLQDCVARAAFGKCSQSDQQVFWDTYTGLCAQDSFTVPGDLKAAGFGVVQTGVLKTTPMMSSKLLRIETVGSTAFTRSITFKSSSSSTATPTTSTSGFFAPTATPSSSSNSDFGTGDIIGTTIGLVGLFFTLLGAFFRFFTWKKSNQTGPRALHWRKSGNLVFKTRVRQLVAPVQLSRYGSYMSEGSRWGKRSQNKHKP